jgi:hypothetical protein
VTWVPATKDEVLVVLEKEREGISPERLALMDQYGVDPYPATLSRFDNDERVFVVAKCGSRVIYFEDVEEVFGIATESEGRLTDPADYGGLALTVGELYRQIAQGL